MIVCWAYYGPAAILSTGHSTQISPPWHSCLPAERRHVINMLLLHNGHYVVCLKETVREYIRAKSVGSRGLGWVRAGGGVQFYMKWSGKPQCQGGFEQRVTGGEGVSLWSGYWEKHVLGRESNHSRIPKWIPLECFQNSQEAGVAAAE